MTEQARRRMLVEEFLGWDDGTSTRYELIDGTPVAMAPASSNHGRIANNIGVLADRALAGRPPCRAIQQGGVRIADRAGGGNVYVPDVLVTCEPVSDRPVLEAPQLIVEILSPSTRHYDERVKLPGYGSLASVEEVWLVEAAARCVHLWQRREGVWSGSFPFIGQASFTSRVLGCKVGLDEVYALTALAVSAEDGA